MNLRAEGVPSLLSVAVALAQRVFNGDDVSQTRLMPQQVIDKVSDAKSPLIGSLPDRKAQCKSLRKLEG